MVDITLYNEKMHVPEGTRVIDLLNEEDKKKYIVCHVGAQIKELRYRLSDKNDGLRRARLTRRLCAISFQWHFATSTRM